MSEKGRVGPGWRSRVARRAPPDLSRFAREATLPYGEGYYAPCAAARGTGFSTIGRLISADATPNATDSHQTSA